MNWIQGAIDGVEVRKPARFADARGWLSEVFRSDEAPPDRVPAMGYVSVTHPGMERGPHEHLEQTDVFGFCGPGRFLVRMWDARKDSRTFGTMMTLAAGEDSPAVVVVPPGVVHGYRNVSTVDAWVLNLPNRLYAGKGRRSPVDERRYENVPDSGFSLD